MKRNFSYVLFVLMLIVIAGCGKKDESDILDPLPVIEGEETQVPQETVMPSETQVPQETIMPTIMQVLTPTATATPTVTPTPTPVQNKRPTGTPIPTPTASPTPTPIGTEKDKFKYVINDQGGIKIVDLIDKSSKEIIVPTLIDGLPVTEIGTKAFLGCTKLESIVLQKGLSSIGKSAFYGCSNLKEVSLPKEMTSIGEQAFAKCSSLKWITMPKEINSIGKGAFWECSSLKQIVLPSGISSIELSTFRDCSSLTEVKLPEGVSSIGDFAFASCCSLKSINLPGSMRSIGEEAFAECQSLTEVSLPNGIDTIGIAAFYNCSSLKEIVIPFHLKRIEDFVFSSCSSLVKVDCQRATSIGEGAFALCSSLENIKMEKVETIGKGAFGACSSLSNVEVSGALVEVGAYAFLECNSFFTITAPAASYAANWALSNGYNLEVPVKTDFIYYVSNGEIHITGHSHQYEIEKLVIPEKIDNKPVVSIENNAFEDCTNLTSVEFPVGLEYIGSCAFLNCKNLKKIEVPSSETSIGSGAFLGTLWLKEQRVGTDFVIINNYIYALGDNLLSKNARIGDDWAPDPTITGIQIPFGVTSFDNYLFYYMPNLEWIVIPSSVDYIWDRAFYGRKESLSFYVESGSYAARWAKQQGFKVKYR